MFMAKTKRTKMSKTLNYRWVVWIDGKSPIIVASRLKAKKLCAHAKEAAYFCRWSPRHLPVEELMNRKISDFLVWQLDSRGGFFRYVYLLTPFIFGEAGHGNRSRYDRALRNPNIWKLGSKEQINSLGYYPILFDEITADSDTGMICAGYRCVGEFPTIRDVRSAFPRHDLTIYFSGTVDNRMLKIWEESNG